MGNSLIVSDKSKVISSISDFNQPFTEYLNNIGLPTEGVLYSTKDRAKIFNALEDALDELSIEERQKSIYLTRFAASIAAGLFDGAITYLWNETIKSIRNMIINFDLEYFYKIAEGVNSRYKGLRTEEDIENIGEYDLLSICNRMELITDHVFEIFKFINYMRNHSSAAHPNENNIKAYDILGWLQNCIAHAINAKPNHSAITVKQFLYNIRNTVIPEEDICIIGENISNLPQQMVDDFLWTLFGMYTDERTNSTTLNNILLLSKYAWNAANDSKKYEIGEKYGNFRKGMELVRKDRANEFLEHVDGNKYKDEESISNEIRECLNDLKSTHYSGNNFYNEYAWAKMLKEMIPTNGVIPETVVKDWVKVITICHCGNGLGYREGVDEEADIYYKEYIDNFKDREIKVLLHLLDDKDLLYDMDMEKTKKRFKRMCNRLNKKTTNIFLKNALNFINNFTGPIDKIVTIKEYKEILAKIKL